MIAGMISILADRRHVKVRLGTALVASAALHLGLAQQLSFFPGSPFQRGAARSMPLQAHFIAAEDHPETSGVSGTGEARAGNRARTPVPATVPTPSSAPGPAQVPEVEETRGIAIGQEPRYFLGSELDRRPVALAPIEPEYPATAGPEGAYLVLRLLIGESGAVDRVRVLVSDPERVFDESAIAAFGRARFSPGVRHGMPVKSQMYIELKYLPRNQQPAAEPMSPGMDLAQPRA